MGEGEEVTTGGGEDEMERGLVRNIIECGGVGGKGVKVQSRGWGGGEETWCAKRDLGTGRTWHKETYITLK